MAELTAMQATTLGKKWAKSLLENYSPLEIDDIVGWTREEIQNYLEGFLMENEGEDPFGVFGEEDFVDNHPELVDDPDIEGAYMEGWELAIDEFIEKLGV